MKFKIAAVSLVATLAVSVQSSAHGQTPKFIEFDAPNSSSSACAPSGCGTYAYASNGWGLIVGYNVDVNIVAHGFLRHPDGSIATFDAPGAGASDGTSEGTYATSINDQGEVAGQLLDANLVYHGFIRYPNGKFAIFDAPGAGTGAYQGTLGEGINQTGEAVGYYVDANNAGHGFVRSSDGAITPFDARGGGTGAGQGTFAYEKSINPVGEISGSTTDSNNVNHGFVRHLDGSFTMFDAPGTGTGQSFGTQAGGINPEGEVTGYYGNATNELFGFLRHHDGSFTTFSIPGGGTGSIQGTAGFSVNAEQSITGIFIDSSNVLHGFLRSSDGAITKLNAPGASNTRPEFVSPYGLVIGFFYDDNGVSHGFAWLPW
jgi:hypothetical protein